MPPGSINPDPISDQNMPFSIRFYALYFVVPLKPYLIPHHKDQSLYPFSDQKGSKSTLFRAAHTFIADIGEYPPEGVSICLKFP